MKANNECVSPLIDKRILLEAVAKRHSVRGYTGAPIASEAAAILQTRMAQINAETGLRIQLLDQVDDVYASLPARACGLRNIPSIIALVGPDTPNLAKSTGYWGEELVLLAQSLGLNTCWTGIYRRKQVHAKIDDGEKLSIIIAVGYGVHQGKPHKGKTFADVTATISDPSRSIPQWFKDGVECALLAPTAMNQQKFVFTLQEDETVLATTAKGSFAEVDLGIASYHFELASEHTVTMRS